VSGVGVGVGGGMGCGTGVGVGEGAGVGVGAGVGIGVGCQHPASNTATNTKVTSIHGRYRDCNGDLFTSKPDTPCHLQPLFFYSQ